MINCRYLQTVFRKHPYPHHLFIHFHLRLHYIQLIRYPRVLLLNNPIDLYLVQALQPVQKSQLLRILDHAGDIKAKVYIGHLDSLAGILGFNLTL